jgi:hypothetical protein
MSRRDWLEAWDKAHKPLHWKHVWIRSVECTGFVCASHQGGGTDYTITVVLTRPDGSWRHGDKVTYTMEEAMVDLVPDVKYLISEQPV